MLYEIERCADVFVDACLRHEGGRLLFLSVFGRDTATKELLARMQLGAQHQDGLAELMLKPSEQVRIQAHSSHETESVSSHCSQSPSVQVEQLTPLSLQMRL